MLNVYTRDNNTFITVFASTGIYNCACVGMTLTGTKLAPLLFPETSCWEVFSQCTNKWEFFCIKFGNI